MKKLPKIIFTITSLLCFNITGIAVTNTAIFSGAWETGTNWSLFHAPLATEDIVVPITKAMTVNANDVCLSLTIGLGGTVTTTGAFTLSIAGDFSNAGTFTAAVGSTIIFNAATNSTVTGAGTFTVKNITLNMGAKTTVLDVQSANFITGINTGNVYNFTFTQGTWKYNNAATLTDCHNNGAATALTIPFTVVIEIDAGTMNLCKGGTNGNVLLSGKLFINGGIALVQYAQAINAGLDLRYKVNGGTPQLYVASGTLNCGAGFNANAGTDYIDFNMTGGTIVLSDIGYSLSTTFLLQNLAGGSTVMSGGTIIIENACNAAKPDIDMGGGNITTYSVTGGTVQFGYLGTQGGATFFGIQYYTATNYPNIDFQAGIAKTVNPWNSDGQTLNAISIFINPAMTLDMTPATPDPNIVFLGNNGVFALSISGTFNVGTGGVTFKGNANQLITGVAAGYTFNNMTINMTAGFTTCGGSITSLNVANYTQTQGNFTAPGNFNVSGNWTHDAGIFTPGVNTVTFNSGGAQQINGAATSETFYNLVINKAGGTLNTGGSMGTITTQNLTQTAGNLNLLTLAAPSTLNINGSYLLTAGTFTTSATTNLLGDWTKNGGTFTPGTGRVFLNGTANSQTIGGSQQTTFYDLTTNNTFGTVPQIILGINNNVTDNITMTSGLVNLAGFTLTLGTSAALPGTLIYTAGWLYGGTFMRWFNTPVLAISNVRGHFPMGSSSNYHPLWMGYTAILTAGGTVSVTHNPATSGSISIPSYNDASWPKNVVGISNSAWTILPANGFTLNGSTAQLRYGGNGFAVFVAADINASLVGSAVGTYVAPTNVVAGSYFEVNRTVLSQANITNTWYIGTSDLGLSPLPIELLSFVAKPNQKAVDLFWSTATETNNDYFTVERSKAGIDFEQVNVVDGAGNSTAVLNYSSVDNTPYEGVSYYRLKQTDFNGAFTYSNIEVVDLLTENDFSFDVFPNPGNGNNINLSIKANEGEEILVVVFDVTGKESYSKVVLKEINGNTIYSVDPDHKLSPGMYLITATSKQNIYTKKLIVN